MARLLADLPFPVPPPLIDKAKVLDNLYVPTRSPTATEGAPFEHYGPLQSEQAILYAGEILDFVRSQMA